MILCLKVHQSYKMSWLEVIENYISIWLSKILQIFRDYNSDALLGTRSYFTFLETSNQYLSEARLSWVFQRSKRPPGHSEKLFTRLKTNAQNCTLSEAMEKGMQGVLPHTLFTCCILWQRLSFVLNTVSILIEPHSQIQPHLIQYCAFCRSLGFQE